MTVLGVDACRTGWAGVLLADGAVAAGVFAPGLAELHARAGQQAEIDVIGVDMPIGLPDAGRRAADVLARGAVGPRWQSVFLTPVRAAVEQASHAAANARSRELCGEGVSRQAYALRPRMLEVDVWVRSVAMPVLEIHPEVSFATLAGRPLLHPKRTWAGATERRRLLEGAGVRLPDDLGVLGSVAGVDDVLDAAVVAWSAQRYADGRAISYPDPPEVFSDGLAAAIWA